MSFFDLLAAFHFLLNKNRPGSFCKSPGHSRIVLHCLFLHSLFRHIFLLPDPLVQIRHTLLDLLLCAPNYLFLFLGELKKVAVHGICTAAIDLRQLLRVKELRLLDKP